MGEQGAATALFMRMAIDKRRSTAARIGGAGKRLGDLAAVAAILTVVLPLMLVIAALVRLWTPGAVFYAHPRIGRGGRSFDCLKFRTMYADADARLAALIASDRRAAAEWAATRKLAVDPRVTPIGRLLRATSLDELPQLVNVLRGEMSIVGPRPIMREEVPYYGSSVRDYVSVVPGLTGLWQVSGRNDLTYAERVRLDARYAREWSPRLDLAILARTPAAILLRRGAR